MSTKRFLPALLAALRCVCSYEEYKDHVARLFAAIR